MPRIPPEFISYFEQAILASSGICGDKLRSIILFGSFAHGDLSKSVSDVDLLFVVSDDTPDATIEKLDSALKKLESSVGPARSRSHFLWVFASRTALFKSHFIVRHGTLLSLDAGRLFEEAESFKLPFGRLFFHLAPKELVVSNILKGAVVVWGENILGNISNPDPLGSLGRVFIVSMVLSLFGAVSSLIFYDGTFFSLEAIKWFLLDTSPRSTAGPPGLNKAITKIRGWGPSHMLRIFIGLRERYRRSVMFSLTCPFYLCYLLGRTTSAGTSSPEGKIEAQKHPS